MRISKEKLWCNRRIILIGIISLDKNYIYFFVKENDCAPFDEVVKI